MRSVLAGPAGESGKQKGEKQGGGEERELEAEGGRQMQVVVMERERLQGIEGMKQDWGKKRGGWMETKKTRVTEINREKWAV